MALRHCGWVFWYVYNRRYLHLLFSTLHEKFITLQLVWTTLVQTFEFDTLLVLFKTKRLTILHPKQFNITWNKMKDHKWITFENHSASPLKTLELLHQSVCIYPLILTLLCKCCAWKILISIYPKNGNFFKQPQRKCKPMNHLSINLKRQQKTRSFCGTCGRI